MEELFLDFDKVPIGSASIAQVHRATLHPQFYDNEGRQGDTPPKQVVVKVQYPEVAELFDAQLANLELAAWWFAPENTQVAKSLWKQHDNEIGLYKRGGKLAGVYTLHATLWR